MANVKMNRYVGALVKLTMPITRNDKLKISTDEVLVVSGHWRGRLTLRFRRRGTLNQAGDMAVRNVRPSYVRVILWPESDTGVR